MKVRQMDLLEIFKTIETMEHELGQLYERFARQLSDDSEAAAFFSQLSREEDSHKAFVQMECQIALNNPAEFSRVQLDIEPIRRALSELQSLLRGDSPTELESMIRLALEFEDNTAECYYRAAVDSAGDDTARLFRLLGVESSGHSKTVNEFAEKRGLLQPDKPGATPKPEAPPSRF